MRRTSWSLIAALIVAGVTLAACAPTATPTAVVVKETVVVQPTPVPPEPVTISFWHIYSEDEMNMLEQTLIPRFEAAHPGVTVESVQIPYQEFRRKLLTAIAGGSAPDLIRSDIIWVPEFAYMGALVALDELMPDFQAYKDAVFAGPLSTNYFDGHYYGLPLDTNCRVMVYNSAMFEAAGIAAPPKTMVEFLAACKKIKALGEDKFCFADGGTYAWAVNPWIWSFGGNVTDADITVASGYLDGAESRAAYQFLKDLVDDGYMHPGILGGGVDSWGGFGNDEIAMILEGPWFPTIFGTDKEYGFALMPAGPGGGISVVGGEDIVMFQQSQHKEEAADFIRFILSEESQLALAEVGQMPVLSALLDTDYMKNHAYYGIFLEQLKNAWARTPHPNFTKMEEVYNLAGAAFLRGEQSFALSLGEAAKTIDGLLILE
jgi:multiple sugar transport system substrate-binding protein